jgi:small-conductance mechanosensitive channel
MREWLGTVLGIDPATQGRILASLVTVVVLWLLRWGALSLVWRRVSDVRQRYRWRKTASYLAVAVGAVIVGRIWFAGVRDLTTFLGLLSAGLAVALRDLIANLAGWAFIMWRRPFAVGDRIQIGTHAGDVIDIRIFQFSLLEIGNWVEADQSTGRIVHVPNGKVFSDPVANYTTGFQYVWDEIPVLVTFESDWKAAKGLLTEIAARHAAHVTDDAGRQIEAASRQFMIRYGTLTPTVFTSVRDSGVLLTIRYLVEPRQRRMAGAAIWEDVLDAFAGRSDIDLAYPTTRFFDLRREGKPQPSPGPDAPPGRSGS